MSPFPSVRTVCTVPPCFHCAKPLEYRSFLFLLYRVSGTTTLEPLRLFFLYCPFRCVQKLSSAGPSRFRGYFFDLSLRARETAGPHHSLTDDTAICFVLSPGPRFLFPVATLWCCHPARSRPPYDNPILRCCFVAGAGYFLDFLSRHSRASPPEFSALGLLSTPFARLILLFLCLVFFHRWLVRFPHTPSGFPYPGFPFFFHARSRVAPRMRSIPFDRLFTAFSRSQVPIERFDPPLLALQVVSRDNAPHHHVVATPRLSSRTLEACAPPMPDFLEGSSLRPLTGRRAFFRLRLLLGHDGTSAVPLQPQRPVDRPFPTEVSISLCRISILALRAYPLSYTSFLSRWRPRRFRRPRRGLSLPSRGLTRALFMRSPSVLTVHGYPFAVCPLPCAFFILPPSAFSADRDILVYPPTSPILH